MANMNVRYSINLAAVRKAQIEVRQAQANLQQVEEQLVMEIVEAKDYALLKPLYSRIQQVVHHNLKY